MSRIRVLVVDDSALVRSLLATLIDAQPDLTCVGAANDPYMAREMIRTLNPDVITLDVEMPRMDGLDFLEKLMRLRPMPVVMVSTLTERGAQVTLRALELGAVDFVAKPRLGIAQGLQQIGGEIAEKIRVAAGARITRRAAPPPDQPAGPRAGSVASNSGVRPGQPDGARATPRVPLSKPLPTGYSRTGTEKVIAIGASTGGTEALREVLAALPADGPAVVITQHMPPGFTQSFAQRLNGLCRMHVKEAEQGERLLPGHAYVAPGGLHLAVQLSGADYVVALDEGPPVNRHRPSVEVLFRSVAQVRGPERDRRDADRHGPRRCRRDARDARRRCAQPGAGRGQLRRLRHAARGGGGRRRARGSASVADRPASGAAVARSGAGALAGLTEPTGSPGGRTRPDAAD